MNGNCGGYVPHGVKWRKSTRSESHGACVEVAPVDRGFAIRDSKNPDGPVMRPVIRGWAAFIGTITAGGLDRQA